jgi:hypothetical protein
MINISKEIDEDMDRIDEGKTIPRDVEFMFKLSSG